MSKIKIALCQIKVMNDKKTNIINAMNAINNASKNNINLVSLPECFNSPYDIKVFPDYAEFIPDNLNELDKINSPTVNMLINAAIENNIYLIGGSIPEKDKNNYYNTSIILSPKGELLGKYRKIHLFDINIPDKIIFRESDILSPGNKIITFDMPQCKVGIGICFDIRFPEHSKIMRDLGCDLLIYPGAFNMITGPDHWELLQKARALDNQLFFATVSPSRNNESCYKAWGHSSVIDPWGNIISTTDEREDIIYAEINFNKCNEIRKKIPIDEKKNY